MLLALLLGAAALAPGPAAAALQGAPAVWQLADRPHLLVGQAAGAPGEEFYRVAAAVRTSGGGLVVANNGTYTLSVFDASGKLLRVIGREGSGPGELRYIGSVELWGDTLFVADPQLRRVTRWRLEGEHLGQYSLPTPGNSATTFLGRFRTGELLLASGTERSSNPGLADESVALVRHHPGTGAVDVLGRVFWRQTTVYQEARGRERYSTTYSLPFAATAAVRVHGEQFVYAGTRDAVAIVYDRTGASRGRLVAPVRPRPTQRALADRYVDSLVARGPQYATRIRNAFAAVPGNAPAPSFRGLQVSPGGYVWLEEFPALGHRTSRWFIFDPGGSLAALIDIPADLQVLSVQDREVITKTVDADGVERVAVYEVLPPGS